MELAPKLIETEVPPEPGGAVIVLHGGAARRADTMVSPTQLSVLRMIPIAQRLARTGRGRLAVFRLFNSRRGWDSRHTPVNDAVWALEQVASRVGAEVPICLVGHSLGGRAAVLASGRPQVRSVVALAPWVYPDDIPDGLSDQRFLFVHGARDRIASPSRSEQLARALSTRTEVGYVRIRDGKHAMLKHHRRFDGLAAGFAAATLLGDEPPPELARPASGEISIDV